jgi:CDP-diacylglycerol--glycerol-3-phosphate 3-phosphatidyltransferase
MTIPNIITIFRIILVPFFVYFVYLSASTGSDRYRYTALFIFLVASLTDFLDGFLARKLKQESYLGRILDVTADKLLIVSSVIIFTFLTALPMNLPYWVALVILLRDFLIITGIFWLWFRTKKIHIKPNIFGKIGITFEMLMIISVLLIFKYSYVLWQAAAVFAFISAIFYEIETAKTLKEK